MLPKQGKLLHLSHLAYSRQLRVVPLFIKRQCLVGRFNAFRFGDSSSLSPMTVSLGQDIMNLYSECGAKLQRSSGKATWLFDAAASPVENGGNHCCIFCHSATLPSTSTWCWFKLLTSRECLFYWGYMLCLAQRDPDLRRGWKGLLLLKWYK